MIVFSNELEQIQTLKRGRNLLGNIIFLCLCVLSLHYVRGVLYACVGVAEPTKWWWWWGLYEMMGLI